MQQGKSSYSFADRRRALAMRLSEGRNWLREQTGSAGSEASTDVGPALFFLIAWSAFTLILLIVLGIQILQSGIINIHEQAHPFGILELDGIPGDTIDLRLYDGMSDDGEWRTHDGFFLKMSDEANSYDTIFTLVSPGYEETCSDCSDSYSVRSSFVVPHVPGEGVRTLSGTITGDVEFPAAETGEIVRDTVEVPVILWVWPSGEFVTSGAREKHSARTTFGIIMMIDGALLAPGVLFFLLTSGFIDTQFPRKGQLELVGVPGDTVRLRLFEGTSRGGAWHSPLGFNLKVWNERSGPRTIIPVLPLTKVEPNSEEPEKPSSFSVNGSLTVPLIPGEEVQVLSGALEGKVQYQKTAANENADTSIMVPTTLRIVPPGQGVTSGKRGRWVWTAFWTGVGVEVVILALGLALVTR